MLLRRDMEASRYFSVPFDNIAEANLHKLKEDEVSEGYQFEFKRESPKAGVGKSVAAFANTHGGYLLIGVEADRTRNVITDIPGIQVEDGLHEKAKNQVVSSVNPVPLFRTRVVPLSDTQRCVLIMEVPESSNPPHFTKDGRVYVRTPTGSDPIPESNRYEVEKLFGKAQRTRELAEQLIDIKLAEAPPIQAEWWAFSIVVCPTALDGFSVRGIFSRAGYERWKTYAAQVLDPVLYPDGFNHEMTQEGLRAFYSGRGVPEEVLELTQGGILHYFIQCEHYSEASYPGALFVSDDEINEKLEKLLSLVAEICSETEYFGSVRLVLVLSDVGGTKLVPTGNESMLHRWATRPSAEQERYRIDREIAFGDISNSDECRKIIEGIMREIRRCFHHEAFDDE